MKERQYKPIRTDIDGVPVIIYIAKDEVPVKNILPNQQEILNYVTAVYKKNDMLATGQYHIVFVWNKDGVPMLDVWAHSVNTHSNSGPLLTCFVFEGDTPSGAADIASGDTIITLAAEEQKRRAAESLSQYLSDDTSAAFPEAMLPMEEFA